MRDERRREYVLWTSVLGLGRSGRARVAEEEFEAEASAARWLQLVDDGRTDESWESAAPLLRGAISEAEWEIALRAARGPLGRCLERERADLERVESVPGAPSGPHVVARFESRFEVGGVTRETVTSTLGDDRAWRVSGYFIG